MKIKVNFNLNENLILKIDYNNVLKEIINQWINKENYHKYIEHTKETPKESSLNLVTFSRPLGKFSFDKQSSSIIYHDKASLIISGCDSGFLTYVAKHIILKESIYIENQRVDIEGVNLMEDQGKEQVTVFTLSPILTFNSLNLKDKKKPHFYNPLEPDFNNIIKKDIIKKYVEYYGREPENENISIEPVDIGRIKPSKVLYKSQVLKVWNGEFIIKGAKELIDIAVASGIGYKNSQGFGCIAVKHR